jgi:hypothetical protein
MFNFPLLVYKSNMIPDRAAQGSEKAFSSPPEVLVIEPGTSGTLEHCSTTELQPWVLFCYLNGTTRSENSHDL